MLSPHPAPAAFDGALRLRDWGVIRAQGPDAQAFLQGQLTQDMKLVTSSQARLAGYCSAKGRLLCTFIAWRAADDEFLLACSADLLAATLKRLSMFVLRAKCKLSDASAEWPLYGLAGASAQAWLGANGPSEPWACAAHASGWVLRWPDADGVPRWLLASCDEPPATLPALQAGAWQWLEVRSGVPRVVAANSEQFVPQMLNLELLDGVSFSKGCYPGQEVVARSQYRGTLKRRTLLVDSAAALAPATEVFHSDDPGQPAGRVVLAATAPDGRHAALVEMKIAARDSGTLHAGSPDGARLVVAALPYSLETLEA